MSGAHTGGGQHAGEGKAPPPRPTSMWNRIRQKFIRGADSSGNAASVTNTSESVTLNAPASDLELGAIAPVAKRPSHKIELIAKRLG